MSKQNTGSNVKNNKFWNFPERTNTVSLFLIGIVFAAIVLVIGIILYSNRKYNYLPDYEESTYSEDINAAFIIESNYTKDDDDIVQTNGISLSYNKNKKNDTSYDIPTSRYIVIGVTENDYEYLSELYKETVLPSTYSITHIFSSLTTNSKKIYDELLVKIIYDYKDSNNKVTKKIQEFSQKMLKLEETELDSIENVNEIKENTDLISVFNVKQTTESSDLKKVTCDLSLKNSDYLDKYKIDFQLFGIDDNGKIYDLIGFYNLSTRAKTSYTKNVTFPDTIVMNTYIAKMKYLDSEGNVHNYVSKITN